MIIRRFKQAWNNPVYREKYFWADVGMVMTISVIGVSIYIAS